MSFRRKIEKNVPPSRRRRRSQGSLYLPRFLRRCRKYGRALLAERSDTYRLPLRILTFGFLLCALFLAVISVAAYVNTETLLQTQRTLRREYATQAHVGALLPALREADAAAQTAVLAAENTERQSAFLACERDLRDQLRTLPTLVATTEQKKQVAQIVPLAERYLDTLHRAADLTDAAPNQHRAANNLASRNKTRETAQALLKTTKSEGMLRQILHEVGILWTDTDNRLITMNRSLESEGGAALFYLIVRSANIGVLGFLFLGFLRYSERQKKEKQELREANFTLASLAQIDPLTGLNNRGAFDQQMEREWKQVTEQGSGLSLLLVDLDEFKSYNDTFGHLAGDDVLKGSAYILQRRARGSDFAGRFGGEEFAVLLPRTGRAEATVVAERVRAAFETARWPCRPVTVSIGVATYSPDLRHVEDLIHEADMALYHAKHRGRNAVSHASELQTPLPLAPIKK